MRKGYFFLILIGMFMVLNQEWFNQELIFIKLYEVF